MIDPEVIRRKYEAMGPMPDKIKAKLIQRFSEAINRQSEQADLSSSIAA